MSETDPIAAAARELEARRAGTDVATVPAEPAAPAPEQNGGDPDEGMSLKVAAQRRAERVAREAEERRSYEAAANLAERPLPANLDASDSELAQQELRQLRETMAEVRQNQDNSYQRMRAEEQQAAAVQHVNQGYEQSRQWAANANAGLEAFIQQERQQLLELFPEAASDAGVIELARVDPFRAQEYAQAFQAGEGRIALAVREQQQAVQNYAENFAAIAELHDRVFLEQNPDMQTPEVQEAAAKGVIEMLKGSGYSDEDIKMGWQIGHGPLANIRSHAIQSGLLELWRSREAKRHLADAKEAGRPLPPVVQKPGSLGAADVSESSLRSLTRNLEEKGSVRAAAALLAARRQYQRGSR